MAVTTRLSDLIVPEVFEPYSLQRSVETSALYQSGIVVPDEQIDALAKGEGKIYELPFYNDLGDDEANIGSDDPDANATAKKISASKDQCIKHVRNQVFSSGDLASAIIGSDPMKVIADRVGDYWNRQDQRLLIASLKGVFADNVANDSGDMRYSVAVTTSTTPTDSNCISGDVVVMGKQTMGDQSKELVAIAMHSVPYSRLQKQNLISVVRNSEGKIMFEEYLGMVVIVDDGCPAVVNATSTKIEYTSYLFGRGAVARGNGSPKNPLEIERKATAGNGEGIENLVTRRHFILHPRGIMFKNASCAGVSPTNTELALAANWDRVYNRKMVRIAAIITNG